MALADNKVKIQALLAGINALPEAGSGEAPAPVLQEKSITPTKNVQSVTPDTGFDGLSLVNVNAIPDEYIVPSGTVSVTENGEHNVREAAKVNVAVLIPEFETQEKSITPTKAAQSVVPDTGYDGLSKVNVGAIPAEYIIPSGTIDITQNGTHNVKEAESVNVNVSAPEFKTQEKTVTPTTSKQTVTPDAAYDGLSKVTVNAMPTATQATPSIEVSDAGLITAKATQTAGYVVEGTKSATKQLTTQAAQTITPGTADKTIASGKYLTGTQTVKGDANLVAANIKKGVSIFGVAGALESGSGGSGGDTEVYSVEINGSYILSVDVIYFDGSAWSSAYVSNNTITVNAAKGVSIVISGDQGTPMTLGGISGEWNDGYTSIYTVTGDGLIDFDTDLGGN